MHLQEDTDSPVMIRYENFTPKDNLADDFSHELRKHLRQMPGFSSAVGYFKHVMVADDCTDESSQFVSELTIKSLTGNCEIHAQGPSLSQAMWMVMEKVLASIQLVQKSRDSEGLLHKDPGRTLINS